MGCACFCCPMQQSHRRVTRANRWSFSLLRSAVQSRQTLWRAQNQQDRPNSSKTQLSGRFARFLRIQKGWKLKNIEQTFIQKLPEWDREERSLQFVDAVFRRLLARLTRLESWGFDVISWRLRFATLMCFEPVPSIFSFFSPPELSIYIAFEFYTSPSSRSFSSSQ